MSHIKNAEAFGKLIGLCTGYAGGYQPGSPNLQVSSLTAMLNEARQSLEEVYSAQTLFDNATNNRELAFKEMRLRSTRVYNVLKACGANELTLQDARSRVRRMDGVKSSATVEAPSENTKTPIAKRTSSGRDYISLTEHFARLIKTVSAEAVYQTNEADLSVESLNQLLATLRNLNDLVVQAAVQLANARRNRNAVMYHMDANMYRTSLWVKAYIKSAFGTRSTQYMEISKIHFTKPM